MKKIYEHVHLVLAIGEACVGATFVDFRSGMDGALRDYRGFFRCGVVSGIDGQARVGGRVAVCAQPRF